MTPRRSGIAAATAALLLSAACAAEPEAASDPFEQEPWTLVGPQLSIGAVDDPDFAFSTVGDLAVGPDGTLYTIHRQEAAIRKWTPAGRPDGTVGGEGQGPGEFQRPGKLGFFGDTLWIMDSYAYRLNYFSPDGTYLDRVTPEVDMGSRGQTVSPARPDTPLRDGTFIGRSPAWSQGIALGEFSSTPIVRMDAEGQVLNDIFSHPWEPHDVLALMREDGQGGSFGPQPFGDGTLAALREDGLVVVDRRVWSGDGPASFTVMRIGLMGDTIFTREIEYTPTALPEARVDSTVKERAEAMHGFLTRGNPGLALGALEEDMRDATFAPAHLPAVSSMFVGDDGTIWLRRYEPVTNDTGESANEWWVLSAAGEPLGRAITPEGLSIMAIDGDTLYGVVTDEFDVNYIVRYEVVKDS